ncbi:MAG: IS200/IS605 family transposase [Planctomycetota bacterium]
MASTHQQLLYHVVFSTKNRQPFLRENAFREHAFAYMAGTIKNLGGYALQIGGWVDHAHLLVRIPAKIAVSDFIGKVKANTSKHINESEKISVRFAWQEGFGAFSVSPSQKNTVIRYIRDQRDHHGRVSFEQEYVELLKRHKVEYDARFVLD